LEGQTVLVTGGGTGIGAAIAREMAHLGANVVIASRKQDRIDRAAAGLSEECGRRVVGLCCDIRDRDAVDRCVSGALDAFGSLDVLVNNGGGQFFCPASAITPRGWDAVVNTNLTGTWNLTRAAADGWMLQHGGRVINITMNTVRGFPGMAHSAAARSGVEGLTRTLAVEWAQHRIQVNCIAPGVIASSGLRTYPDPASIIAEAQREIPAKRLGTCEEIAWAAAFLASPAGDYVTGQTFIVDGGRTLWGQTWPIPDPDEPAKTEIPIQPWEHEGSGD
jgi:NAD(P)-dependent dehydrogenase (short-subunit alcohol dehydrogenase family)